MVTDYEEEKEELNIEIMRLKRELSFFDGLKDVMERQGLKANDVKIILLKNKRFRDSSRDTSQEKRGKVFFGAQDQIKNKERHSQYTNNQNQSERESRESSVASLVKKPSNQMQLGAQQVASDSESGKKMSFLGTKGQGPLNVEAKRKPGNNLSKFGVRL